jgi:endonuclease YncB( thermonuclease family)
VGVCALIGAIGLHLFSGRIDLPLVSRLPAFPFTGGETVKGKATALTADMLRIGNSRLRLSGIEVPDPDQRCIRAGSRSSGRTWACGQDAREAVQRLVQGQTLTCEVGRKDAAGVAKGTCRVGGADIGEALVRAGYAFAESGLVSPYRGAEDSARVAKAGVWGSTEPERPAAWRERLWSAAKRQAPDGCPIKGRVRGNEREYLLPWSSDYERARISARRGERWFCSEEEAVAAGWRSARRG